MSMLSTKVLQVRLRFPEVGVPLHAERRRTNMISKLNVHVILPS